MKVKNTIDRSYRTPRQLSEIAAELGISPAVMSRYFKKAYGLPPVHYRHHLRTMEAMMRLLEGRAVKDVYLDVGFDDLSRFYRHFRDHMMETGAVFVRRSTLPRRRGLSTADPRCRLASRHPDGSRGRPAPSRPARSYSRASDAPHDAALGEPSRRSDGAGFSYRSLLG